MSIKPILFNTEMVRAILDGRKTMTRRVIKSRVSLNEWKFYELHDNKDGAITCNKDKMCAGFYQDEHIFYIDGEKRIDAHYYLAPCKPGDILYVRETWGYDIGGIYIYKATYKESFTDLEDVDAVGSKITWHPSIHMPKEAARIWLKVTDVKVERLRDITTEECIKEGFEGVRCDHAALGFSGCTDCMNTGWLEPPQVGFMYAWDSTIKKKDLPLYGWDANPWVWVIEFERYGKPEVSKGE